MGSLLFSPNGRVGPEAFMQGAIVLIAISFLINLMPMVSPILGGLLKIFMLVIGYCWIVLFMKRYRAGGDSPWMVFLPIIVFVIMYFIYSTFVPPIFGGDVYANMQTALEDAIADNAGLGAIMTINQEFGPALAKKIALPGSLVFAAMSYALAWLFNRVIKVSPE